MIELGAADDDAIAVCEAGCHDDVGRVERLRADRPRLEILRLAMPPDDRLAIAAAHDGIAVDDDAGDVLSALRRDGDRLADTERRGGSEIAKFSTVACCCRVRLQP